MHRNLKINFFHVHQTNLKQNYFDCVILTEFNRSDRTWIFSWSKMGVTNKFHLCGARFNAYNGRHCLSATVVEWMAMKPERVLSYMSLLPFLSFYSYLPIKKSNWHELIPSQFVIKKQSIKHLQGLSSHYNKLRYCWFYIWCLPSFLTILLHLLCR